jgi:putative two-component system response regulator
VLQNKWALVVEDDAHSLVAISSLLRDLGIPFKRNTTGANVPEQIHAMTPAPDFILLDLDLLNGTALSIYRRLKLNTATRDIPVLALSAKEDFPLRQRLQREGFAALIIKPLPRLHFGDIVRRVLQGEQVWEAAI